MNNLIKISNSYYNKALDLVNINEFSNAIELIEKCLRYYSKDVEVLNLMGICYYTLCDFDKAFFYWSKSLINSNENNRAKYYLDVLNSDNFKKFIKKYNLAIENVDNIKYKDAINMLEEIIKLNRDLIEPYAIISFCYYELKKYDLAKKYMQQALDRDKNNAKYLIYLNEINNKNISLKTNKTKSNIIIFSLSFLLIALVLVSYYQKYNMNIKILNQSEEYQKKIQQVSIALEKSKNEYSKLENKFKYENNNEGFSHTEFEIFKSAIFCFRKHEYSEAINQFKYIVNKGIEESLVSESTYYIAVCFEKEDNYKMAEKYYSMYINKFKNKNYYDDSLYNYGLILYKQGDKINSKKVLNKLQQEVPNSIFINSKVKFILNN